jgi:hypothetical protein
MKAVIALGVPAEKLRFILDSKTGKIAIDICGEGRPADAANPWDAALADLQKQPANAKRKQK